MATFPTCVGVNLADYNAVGQCITQSIGMNDPVLIGIIVMLGFILILLIGRQHVAVAAMVVFALAAIYYMITLDSLFLIFTALIVIGAMILGIRGFKQHVQ